MTKKQFTLGRGLGDILGEKIESMTETLKQDNSKNKFFEALNKMPNQSKVIPISKEIEINNKNKLEEERLKLLKLFKNKNKRDKNIQENIGKKIENVLKADNFELHKTNYNKITNTYDEFRNTDNKLTKQKKVLELFQLNTSKTLYNERVNAEKAHNMLDEQFAKSIEIFQKENKDKDKEIVNLKESLIDFQTETNIQNSIIKKQKVELKIVEKKLDEYKQQSDNNNNNNNNNNNSESFLHRKELENKIDELGRKNGNLEIQLLNLIEKEQKSNKNKIQINENKGINNLTSIIANKNKKMTIDKEHIKYLEKELENSIKKENIGKKKLRPLQYVVGAAVIFGSIVTGIAANLHQKVKGLEVAIAPIIDTNKKEDINKIKQAVFEEKEVNKKINLIYTNTFESDLVLRDSEKFEFKYEPVKLEEVKNKSRVWMPEHYVMNDKKIEQQLGIPIIRENYINIYAGQEAKKAINNGDKLECVAESLIDIGKIYSIDNIKSYRNPVNKEGFCKIEMPKSMIESINKVAVKDISRKKILASASVFKR